MLSCKLLLCVWPVLFSASIQNPAEWSKLNRLTGTWKSANGKRIIYENWNIINTGALQGKSYLLVERDTMVLEEITIQSDKEGIFYVPTVKNQNGGQAVSFKLVSSLNQHLIFENLKHDFPQRIIYNFINQDSIHAWIEGKQNDKNIRRDYYYTRVK